MTNIQDNDDKIMKLCNNFSDYVKDLLNFIHSEEEYPIEENKVENKPKALVGLDLAIYNVLRDYYSIEKKEKCENNKNEQESEKFEYDYKIDENGKRCTKEVFFYKSLNKAIEKNPNFVSEYPELSILYSKDGKVKSFEEIISKDSIIKEASKYKIPEYFCKYYISNGKLDGLELSGFSEKVQANIVSGLISILKDESIQIGIMDNEVKKHKQENEEINDKIGDQSFHLKNTKYIMNFINTNYQNFRNLQEKNAFSYTMNMDYYDEVIEGFKNDSTYNNLAVYNPESIGEIKQLASEAEENKNIYFNNEKIKTVFNPNEIEASFEALLLDTRQEEFENAMQTVRYLPHEAVLRNDKKA